MGGLIGRFFFKLTDNRNLIGEFSNNKSGRIYTEGAGLKPRNPDQMENPGDGEFVGEDFSTWFEEAEHKSVLAELKIEKKTNAENIFRLTCGSWKTKGLLLNSLFRVKACYVTED